MLSGIKGGDMEVCNFVSNNKNMTELMVKEYKGGDRQFGLDSEVVDSQEVRDLYKEMVVHYITPDCHSAKNRVITGTGGFEKVEDSVLSVYPELMVKVEISRDLLDQYKDKVLGKGGSIHNNIINIRADQLDRPLRTDLNLTKQRIKVPSIWEKEDLVQELNANGIGTIKEKSNSVLIFCDKAKLDLVRNIIANPKVNDTIDERSAYQNTLEKTIDSKEEVRQSWGDKEIEKRKSACESCVVM